MSETEIIALILEIMLVVGALKSGTRYLKGLDSDKEQKNDNI